MIQSNYAKPDQIMEKSGHLEQVVSNHTKTINMSNLEEDPVTENKAGGLKSYGSKASKQGSNSHKNSSKISKGSSHRPKM